MQKAKLKLSQTKFNKKIIMIDKEFENKKIANIPRQIT
ncbi:unnamed protein product [Paramecium pentaurelia]|uniref:Uncharacterized protein n=1 Tax=Paramecium pentaurelia TaxID=43138 RepID=A0A8S1UTP5_9CILI|nr:unnamed protein product [Paramecium pentaurelia]